MLGHVLSLVQHVISTDYEPLGRACSVGSFNQLNLGYADLCRDYAHSADDCVDFVGLQNLGGSRNVRVIDREVFDSILGRTTL